MINKGTNKINTSDITLAFFFLGVIILAFFFFFTYPLITLPIACIITFLSIIIYKKEILLPEKHSQKEWLVYCLYIVVGLFFVMLMKKQEILNAFADLFVDGHIQNGERLSEGSDGGEFLEEVTVFIPDTEKGSRLISFIEYSFWAICAGLIFLNFKLFDYESEKSRNELWFISALTNYFDKNFQWSSQVVPAISYIELSKYYESLDEVKNWHLRQKINFQLAVFCIQHYKGCRELPDSWQANNNTCLMLSEVILTNTIYHFKNHSHKISTYNNLLPYERSLIIKAIAYYIHAIKTNTKEVENRVQKNSLITLLYSLFYHIQDQIKAPGGRQSRKVSIVLKEDVFYPVTNVILVDDHQLFRWGIKKCIENNYSVKIKNEAENGQELINLLNHSTSDIISLGIQMPVMDGFVFLEKFNYQVEPKIISLSFLNSTTITLRALSLGASSYIHKSQTCETISKAYKQVHSYGFYYSSTIREAIKKISES